MNLSGELRQMYWALQQHGPAGDPVGVEQRAAVAQVIALVRDSLGAAPSSR